MPASKKRKKRTAGKPGNRRPARHPLARRPTGDPASETAFDHDAIRTRFVDLSRTEGHLFPAIKGYEPYGPPVECWTNAWNYATATGLGYAEGAALMPNGWHAHAWCVTDDGAVIEPTVGYDHAVEYRGWCLNTGDVAAIMAQTSQQPHSSFLEAALGSGVATWEEIRARFTFVPGTA